MRPWGKPNIIVYYLATSNNKTICKDKQILGASAPTAVSTTNGLTDHFGLLRVCPFEGRRDPEAALGLLNSRCSRHCKTKAATSGEPLSCNQHATQHACDQLYESRRARRIAAHKIYSFCWLARGFHFGAPDGFLAAAYGRLHNIQNHGVMQNRPLNQV